MSSKQEQSGPPDVDQSMKELLKQPGVEGYMVFNDTGIPVKWSASGFVGTTGAGTPVGGGAQGTSTPIPADVIHYAALISDLTAKSRQTCGRLFAEDDPDRSQLQLIRLRTTENEVIIAPGEGCTLVVLQNPNKVKKVETKAEVAEEK